MAAPTNPPTTANPVPTRRGSPRTLVAAMAMAGAAIHTSTSATNTRVVSIAWKKVNQWTGISRPLRRIER